MSLPDGGLRRREGEPPFAEPWHAQALAMADLMEKSGRFTASRWTEALGTEIVKLRDSQTADDADSYYGAVLAALELLLAEAGDVTHDELEQRCEDWEQAYLRTPHGQPVALRPSNAASTSS